MRLLIMGAGVHGQAVADLAAEEGAHAAVAFTDADPTLKAASRLGLPIWGDDAAGVAAFREGRCDAALVGVGNTAMAGRRRLFELGVAAGIPAPSLTHPRAVVARSATLGAGSVVFGGAVLAAR